MAESLSSFIKQKLYNDDPELSNLVVSHSKHALIPASKQPSSKRACTEKNTNVVSENSDSILLPLLEDTGGKL